MLHGIPGIPKQYPKKIKRAKRWRHDAVVLAEEGISRERFPKDSKEPY
jgi:hypothetical protein